MKLIPLFAEANFDSVMNNGLSLSDKALQSVQMLLMGMGTVFSVLFVIWLALTIFRVIVHDIPAKRAAAKQNKTGIALVDGLNKVEDSVTNQMPSDDDDMSVTVAIITAAVQAYMDSQGIGNTAFKVVSFKRKGPAVPWNGNGRI